MIESIPQLRCLDEYIVMDFERKDMAEMYPPNTWKGERVQELKRFRPFNKETNSWAGIRYNLLVKGEEEVYNIRDE